MDGDDCNQLHGHGWPFHRSFVSEFGDVGRSKKSKLVRFTQTVYPIARKETRHNVHRQINRPVPKIQNSYFMNVVALGTFWSQKLVQVQYNNWYVQKCFHDLSLLSGLSADFKK